MTLKEEIHAVLSDLRLLALKNQEKMSLQEFLFLIISEGCQWMSQADPDEGDALKYIEIAVKCGLDNAKKIKAKGEETND